MGPPISGFSLRIKITASFVMLVLIGTAVSTLLGSRIITQSLLREAHKRVHHGLEAARMVYGSKLERVRRIVFRAATNERVVDAALARDKKKLQAILSVQQQKERAIDFLSFIDPRGEGLVHAAGLGNNPALARRLLSLPLVRSALRGRTAESSERFTLAELREVNPTLCRQARVVVNSLELREISPTFNQQARDPLTTRLQSLSQKQQQGTSGLMLVTAAPVVSKADIIGIVFGGVLLNNESELVDQIKDLIFGREQYQGTAAGAVSIFLEDIRIATNFMLDARRRAVGTRLSPEIAQTVLVKGKRWTGRARLKDAWFINAYEPIRNQQGQIIGALGVGLLEAPFLAVRTSMMLTFLVVALLGSLIVLGVTYLITRSTIHPLEEMVAVTKKIAAGDFDCRVSIHSGDEIGHLAASFNRMLDSLNTMRGQLQEWAHTLEEKVQQRTDELVAVEQQMAQSEKLSSLGRMAAGVAHEINNPLGGILTFAMLGLEECTADNPLHGKLELISKQALRCRDIVKGMLEFSRQSDFTVAPTDVNSVINKTLTMLWSPALFQSIETRRKLMEKLPPILIDPGQLQQVIVNLVLNAIDAMEQHGTLTIETLVHADAGEVILAVGDTGKGIPDQVLPLIFEPFFTTKKVGQGTGLGLAIVHGIVTRVGGKIDVRTSPSGTTFIVRFPKQGAAAANGAIPSAIPS